MLIFSFKLNSAKLFCDTFTLFMNSNNVYFFENLKKLKKKIKFKGVLISDDVL